VGGEDIFEVDELGEVVNASWRGRLCDVIRGVLGDGVLGSTCERFGGAGRGPLELGGVVYL
jgi:hypothetical protein